MFRPSRTPSPGAGLLRPGPGRTPSLRPSGSREGAGADPVRAEPLPVASGTREGLASSVPPDSRAPPEAKWDSEGEALAGCSPP